MLCQRIKTTGASHLQAEDHEHRRELSRRTEDNRDPSAPGTGRHEGIQAQDGQQGEEPGGCDGLNGATDCPMKTGRLWSLELFRYYY